VDISTSTPPSQRRGPTLEVSGQREEGLVEMAKPRVAGRGNSLRGFLGALYGGRHRGPGAAGTDGWFREAAGEPGTFFADVRFSRPGRWALSFMDLEGMFHDFGIRSVVASTAQVRPVRERGTEPLAAVSDGDTSAWIWYAAGGTCLTRGAALFLANRRKHR
jgi:hypothetical protein